MWCGNDMKINRDKIFNKYDGHCAYCGVIIDIKKFQVDHIYPKHLSHHNAELHPDREENLNPSCCKCNNHKFGFRLEDFRHEIQMQVTRLKNNSQFQRALRYGQIQITETPIKFYYEKLKGNEREAK